MPQFKDCPLSEKLLTKYYSLDMSNISNLYFIFWKQRLIPVEANQFLFKNNKSLIDWFVKQKSTQDLQFQKY